MENLVLILAVVLSMQGKSSASLKESSLLGVSLSDHVKADFSSSTLKWKVATMPVHSCFFLAENALIQTRNQKGFF
jgi:hypothetical protein